MFAVSIIAAYLVGSFPTSYLIARMLKGVDIRQSGSKNAGATNVFRVVGKIPGLITLVLDILKGMFVVTLISGLSYRYVGGLNYDLYRMVLGFVAICGHIWPVFLKFKGGKGVATTIGVALVVAPKIFALTVGAWLVVFVISGYVSLASIISLSAFPVFAAIFGSSLTLTIFSSIIGFIVISKHKSNIHRLLNGKEPKTRLFRS